MKVSVWDTYVKKEDGTVMHFDIIAPTHIEKDDIYAYGKEYLKTKGLQAQTLSSKECQFCHIEMLDPQWEAAIEQKGFFIYEMENCN